MRELLLLLCGLGLSACAQATRRAAPTTDPSRGVPVSETQGEHRILKGDILVVEKRSELAIDQILILVGSQERKETVQALVDGASPIENLDRFGPNEFKIKSLDAPLIETVDEYVEGLDRSNQESRQKDPSYPFPPINAKKKKAEIRSELGNRFALIYRYIHAPGKKSPNQNFQRR